MQLSNFVKPLKCLPATCGPLLKVALWLGGLTNIFVGIIGGIWWPFVTIVALSLHIRLPVPLGMVPPIFDATGNAFVTSAASFIGVLTLWSAYFYMNPIWLVCAGLFFGKSFQYHRHKAAVKEKFRLLDLNHNLASNSEQIYPSMPFFVRLHPYFLRMYKDTNLGGGVRIRRIDPSSGTTTSSIDLWYQEDPEKSGQSILLEETTSSDLNTRDEKTSSKKPLFFFIHGGGWKGGGSRRHTQPVLLHRLVLNGWVVVACNYRKKKWPQHIDDCYNSLQYLMKEANSFDIDTSRIVVSGASAGGQLAALLHARIEADAASNIAVGSRSTRSSGSSTKRGADRKITPHRVVAMVLFYPALDPADDANFTATFPFDVPFMKAKSKQSLMHWFFERVILDDDISQW